MNDKNNILEIRLEDANRLLTFYQTKEKGLIEGEFFCPFIYFEFLKKSELCHLFFVCIWLHLLVIRKNDRPTWCVQFSVEKVKSYIVLKHVSID